MPYRFTDPARYPYRQGSIFLGSDLNGSPVGIATERHAITVGGSRSGKGAALLIPNARRWPDNLLVIDPKGENVAASWEQREAMGQRVYVLDPFKVADIPDRLRASFNPLGVIDPASPTAREDVQVIADGLVKVHDPKHMEWVEGARDILAGVMAYVLAAYAPEDRTFATVRQILMQPDSIEGDETRGLYADAQRMEACYEIGGLSHAAGVMLLTAIESSKAIEKDFLSNARRASKWLDSDAIRATLAASTFRLSELKTGAASVYLVLPPDYISTYASFLRLFVRCALNAMARGGAGRGRHCLFLLDEFFSLGRIEEIATAAGLMPGYGVHLWPFVQDLGQLIELYGRHVAPTFFGNADAAAFFGNGDPETLDYVSARLGTLTADEVAPDVPVLGAPFFNSPEGQQAVQRFYQNERTVYEHAMRQAGRPRLTADQVRELVAKKDGDAVARSMIVFAKGGDVLNLRLTPYFAAARPTAAPAPLMQHHAPARPPVPLTDRLPWLERAPRKLASVAAGFLAAWITAKFIIDPLLIWSLGYMTFGWGPREILGVSILAGGAGLVGYFSYYVTREVLSDYLP